jgi:hypothetical protein
MTVHKELEQVSSDYHGVLGGLHGFGVVFFVLRFIRNVRRGRRERGLLGWAAFHMIAAGISFICSHIHARDAQ